MSEEAITHLQNPLIRVARLDDEAGIAQVCLRTAHGGQDASGLYSRPDLPALIWAAPYLFYDASHCFVVEIEGQIAGYIVTAANTRAYEDWQHRVWWPQVEARLEGFVPETEGDQTFLKSLAQNQKPAPAFADRYPAHLHINLLERAQGGGLGRQLVEAAFATLRDADVSGIHLGVNPANHKAIGFYKAMGFEQVTDIGALILARDV